MRINVSQVYVGSEERVLLGDALSSGGLVQGRLVAELEARFGDLARAHHVVATSSGTTALQLALEVAGVGPGDEVVTSPFTFVATLNAILVRGAIARLVDIDPDTFNVDPDLMDDAVSSRTKALMPVHLYGLPADMERIGQIADRRGLRLVEDAAQAHFSKQGGYHVGTRDLGCFSLYATKNLAAGEGGLITAMQDVDDDSLRVLRNQGMRSRYEYVTVGYNFRLTDMAAALALGQLSRIDDTMAIRSRNAEFLTSALADLDGLITPTIPQGYKHVWHQYTVRLTPDARVTRDELAAELDSRDIGSGIYYPKILPDHAVFGNHPGVQFGDLSVARRIASEVLSLPVHQGLTLSDLERIASAVRSIVSDA
ncbi:MAG TPA: DegT/DnrJ/EryC1/StrS family aminotransferase [Candidatus Dormibacteraeota bacterium]|nr:DegT/DnrJ/EryC1/StrS family aminotransferase [Candidatus Dormibacteraeota bacterium]